jgi:hypothetical protein
MVLLTGSKHGPLVRGGWDKDMMYGVVTERSQRWIKVAFETGPNKFELQSCDTWRWVRPAAAVCLYIYMYRCS